jgi:hypothetical protein
VRPVVQIPPVPPWILETRWYPPPPSLWVSAARALRWAALGAWALVRLAWWDLPRALLGVLEDDR